MNHFKLPLVNPFKFVKATTTPGIHFDDDWACKQIRDFERRVFYKQKWKRTDTTLLQCESSIPPQPLKVLNTSGLTIKTIEWGVVFTNINYKIYEALFDVSDLPVGVYVLYQTATFGSINFKAISEPIHSAGSWPNTLLFTYTNSYNDWDVAFSTGIKFKFRCEAGIMDFVPQRDRVAHTNQTANVTTLSGVPSRVFTLYIATADGVAPWVLDLLNRIFLCDSIDIENMFYQSDEGSKWEVTRIKGYPLIGGSIDIVPAYNNYSLEFADGTEQAGGIVIAYNIETSFFGQGSIVPVLDVENQY